ncbi:MAG: 4Fe-4S dicluster domain-containing protein [Spirochaetaceae bacterium]|nr:MAG: 4Fe-4S dicluster domain-containing protein [Spirochaetaceae bacterium]
MLRALLRQFDTPLPEVDFRRCLRSRDVNAGTDRCTICSAVCPQAAVTFSAGVQLNAGSCTSCGVCAAACPTEAITDPRQQRTLLEGNRRIRTVSVGCRLGSNDGGSWSCPVQAVCGLSWRFVAAAALLCPTRRVLLDCRNCDSCTHGPGTAPVADAARRATTFLAALGLSCSIEVVTDSTSSDNPGAVSRRLFLGTALGLAGNTARRTPLACGLPQAPQKSVRGLLWKAALEAHSPADNHDAAPASREACSPWGSFTVSSDCTGCGDCALICPWQAWHIATSADTRTILFSMWRCRNCGYCVSRCPRNAIRRTSEVIPRPQTRVQTLATVPVPRCRRCKKSYVELFGGLCHNCTKQTSLAEAAAYFVANGEK